VTLNLILDLGLHDAEDTSYYLESGYDVVAVDANPAKCAAATQRFEAEIASGRLEVLNVGIADTGLDDLTFWVSSVSEWSSFHRDHATKGRATATPIHVPVVSFGELLARYATPLYVKIDIEGNDSFCLREMCRGSTLPGHVSFEVSSGAAADIEVLSQSGYQEFKCIRQNDWREITPRNMRWQGYARKVIARVNHAYRLHYRARRVDGRRFVAGSSGPLPWTLPGGWWSAQQVQAVCDYLLTIDRELNAGGLSEFEWFDIHARIPARIE
jgi:FkbM family methyltransferase